MDHQPRNNLPEPRNSGAARPDAGLRWAGRLLFVTIVLLIADLALQPGVAARAELFGKDKIEHLTAFFALTVLARLGWPRLRAVVTGTILFAYGGWIEIAQSSPGMGRTASGADLVADTIGILAGLGAAAYFGRVLMNSGR